MCVRGNVNKSSSDNDKFLIYEVSVGLDQYAYASSKAITEERSLVERLSLAYWRKHPNLQGWMERLWVSKGYPNTPPDFKLWEQGFNGIELELDREDIDRLERDIENGELAKLETTGFFFGNASDDYYRELDLKFCREARANLFSGLRVFYNSSW